MITVAIDPGVWALGWAVLDGGRLRAAGCSKLPKVRHPDLAALAVAHANQISSAVYEARGLGSGWGQPVGHDSAAVRIVLEYMRTRGRDAPEKPQDLIDVQAVGCLTAARLGHVARLATAQEWKGSVPKDVHHPRILRALDPREREIVDCAAQVAGANAKEVLDATGIALQDAGRIDTKGDATT